jgi:hypothetical protein
MWMFYYSRYDGLRADCPTISSKVIVPLYEDIPDLQCVDVGVVVSGLLALTRTVVVVAPSRPVRPQALAAA